MAYDKVLRERALLYREKHSQKETCEVFALSVAALKLWQKQYKETGSLENKPLERKWRKIDPEKLKADVQAYPDDFNDERAQQFGCSGEAIRQALQKLIITRKKSFTYREKSEENRQEYLGELTEIPYRKLIYVDESGINNQFQCEYGYRYPWSKGLRYKEREEY